jgi:Pectate lyase superfamily protein/Right handed beta helix region
MSSLSVSAAQWLFTKLETRSRRGRSDRPKSTLCLGLRHGKKQQTLDKKYVTSELISRFVRQGCRLPFFFVTAASVSFALQLLPLNGGTLTSGTTDSTAASISNSSNATTTDAAAVRIRDKGGQVVNVKEYGAVGNGVTNDTAAFIKALEVCAVDGGTCLVPEGTYLISPSGISTGRHRPSVLSGVHLTGAGRAASILKIAGMPTDNFLPCEGDNWSVENLTFDMGDYTPPSVGFAAIGCRGNNWRVANCAIIKSGKWGIAAFGGSNWSIEGNYIRRTVPGATPPTGAILVTASAGVWSTHGRVINNVCEGVGITFSGSDGLVAGNQISRSGSGSGIFVQGLPSTHSPTIIGNVCSGGSSGFDAAQGGRWWSVNGFEVWAPDSVICNNIAHDNDGGGFAIGGQSSIVVGNKAYNNGRGHHGYAGFNARINLARGTSASHSIFIGNSAYDQDYGYKEQGSGLSDIKQIGNDYNRNRRGPVKDSSAGGQMPISPKMKSKLKALADDADIPDSARRVVREYLSR